jgi:hypothetical protein
MACGGNSAQICGGILANSIYKTGMITTTTTTTTTTSTTTTTITTTTAKPAVGQYIFIF